MDSGPWGSADRESSVVLIGAARHGRAPCVAGATAPQSIGIACMRDEHQAPLLRPMQVKPSPRPTDHHLSTNPTLTHAVAAGGNKSAHSNTGANLKKLEEETEDFHGAFFWPLSFSCTARSPTILVWCVSVRFPCYPSFFFFFLLSLARSLVLLAHHLGVVCVSGHT